MNVKRSVSVAIRDDAGRVLAVRRPPDDEELPDAWGLPAASLREGESWEDAVRRAGRGKLGVELEPGAVLNEGGLDRGDPARGGYRLHMRLFAARIAGGTPAVPQPDPDVTQYAALSWSDDDVFVPAARAGSLCCRLYLER